MKMDKELFVAENFRLHVTSFLCPLISENVSCCHYGSTASIYYPLCYEFCKFETMVCPMLLERVLLEVTMRRMTRAFNQCN